MPETIAPLYRRPFEVVCVSPLSLTKPTMSQSDAYTLPGQRRSSLASTDRRSRKPWQKRVPLTSWKMRQSDDRLSRHTTRASGRTTSTHRHDKWWQIRWFRGMIHDIRRRAPYYVSDWTDAWDYRVVPATIYMYFAK